MTVEKFFKGLLQRDMYDLYIWAVWYFRPGRVSCIDCIKTRANISGNPPDCSKCGNPTATALRKYFRYKETSFKDDSFKDDSFNKDILSAIGEEIIVDE